MTNPYDAPRTPLADAPQELRKPHPKAKDARLAFKLLCFALMTVALSTGAAVLLGATGMSGPIFLLPFGLLALGCLASVFFTSILAEELWGRGALVWASLVFGLILIVVPLTALFGWLRLRDEPG
jgi:hypothetical protein